MDMSEQVASDAAQEVHHMKIKCISKTGFCVVTGCEDDGECYIWRCENPHAPRPDRDEPEKTYAIRSALLALAAWCAQWSWLVVT